MPCQMIWPSNAGGRSGGGATCGAGGATDTISSFVYREYSDRSNVGYATMVAEVYLVLIIIFITLLLKAVSRQVQKMT